jgi:hypothetical protein
VAHEAAAAAVVHEAAAAAAAVAPPWALPWVESTHITTASVLTGMPMQRKAEHPSPALPCPDLTQTEGPSGCSAWCRMQQDDAGLLACY